ncbi:MAG: peptidoglycan DD-metalloendopeptidase family protein [Solirubrobacterales bacterium]|nr:peptidoglycan DD-metalloendopeptidase family protein [Solirubrobacterales bacterium]
MPFAFGSAANGAAVGGGGLVIPDVPEVSDVICLTGCTKMREVSPGGTVQITGTAMGSVKYVVFRGEKKNIRVEPDVATETRVEATVPEGAVTGRVRVLSATGSASDPSTQTLSIGSQTFGRTGKLRITDAQTSPQKAYQYGSKRPTISFVVNGSTETVDLRVDIVNAGGDVVRSKFLNGVPSGSTQKVVWSGLVAKNKTAPNGAYHFVIRGNDGSNAQLSSRLKRQRKKAKSSRARSAQDPFGFRIYGYIFPLRGAHTYGDGIGAARSGHTHQGQDVLAACGRPLVAARAGVVYYNSYQAGGAGNYVVINVKGAGGKSHVYMHMSSRSPLKVGTRVKTGQRVGTVGTTGASSACHLHFEIWSGPGWYQGGTFLDPTPSLKKWDRYS